MSSWKWLAFIFLNMTYLFGYVKSQSYLCGGNGNYTSNSTYIANLNTLLSSISSNMDSKGFYNTSMGENDDRVNAIALCRGDVQLDTCQSCINNATRSILQLCPYQKQAIYWASGDSCMLRYSNESIFGKLETFPRFYGWRIDNVTSRSEFNQDLETLLDSLHNTAADGGSLKKFAAANATGSDLLTIYGLVQCTPDLTSDDCSNCLTQVTEVISQCCSGRQGFGILTPSCILRYETYPFFNDIPQPAPPPQPGSVPILEESRTSILNYPCGENGTYTGNSIYSANLNSLLSSVSSNIDTNGFYNASMGEYADRVNVIALCRGDVQLNICRSCIYAATRSILQSCPHKKQATFRDSLNLCMLRYSNENIFGTLVTSPEFYTWDTKNVTSPEEFNRDLKTLLNNLRSQAAYGGSHKKFAAATSPGPDSATIEGLMQCTPDITSEDCRDCLSQVAQFIPWCCNGKPRFGIFTPSCILQYETYPSKNDTPQPLPALVREPPGNDVNKTRTIIIKIVPIVVGLILALCIGIVLRMRRNTKTKEIHETDNEISTVESLQYDFGTIRAATNSFSDDNKLGQGGFGVVYKGKLPRRQEIAVKRLSMNSVQGDLEFKNEVLLMARLHHRNLVRLLGFSLERSERLLVYEFVQNGSLDRFIFDPIKRQYLDWDTRYKIIGGVAKGLLYLHEESRLRIIHRDLKASNVLLDGEMNPKISDFGMARLIVQDETQGNTSRIVGTYGYMAPEYVIHGQFSSKSDVFSFGVLVLEIVSGKKTNSFQSEENMENLLSCAWKNWHEGTTTQIIDPALRTSTQSLCDIMRCIHIGLLCVQEKAVDRPTMAAIVLMLTSFSITLSIPSRPAFFLSSSSDPEISLLQEQNSRPMEATESSKNRSGNSTDASINDVSMSDLYPR